MIGVVGRVPSSTSPMQEPDAILRTAVPFVSGSKTPGGAGTFTGHTGNRITQTNITTIQYE
jgi:hypothetical protein